MPNYISACEFLFDFSFCLGVSDTFFSQRPNVSWRPNVSPHPNVYQRSNTAQRSSLHSLHSLKTARRDNQQCGGALAARRSLWCPAGEEFSAFFVSEMFCGALDDRQASRRPAWMKIRGAEPQQNMSAPQKVLFEQKKRGKSGKMGRGRGKTGFRCPRGQQGRVQEGEIRLPVPRG